MTNVSYNSIAITREFVISNNADPVYYVFNINDKGFVIVSAEDAVEPILGYSFESSYGTDHQSPEFRFWMNIYKDHILYARSVNLSANSSVKREPGSFDDHRPSATR